MVLVSYFFEKCFLFSTKSLEKVWKSNFRYLIRWFFKLQIHQVKPGMKSSLFTFSLAKILALSFQTEWVNCHHRLSGGSWSRSGPNCVLWIVNPYYEEDLHFSKSSSDMGKWKKRNDICKSFLKWCVSAKWSKKKARHARSCCLQTREWPDWEG